MLLFAETHRTWVFPSTVFAVNGEASKPSNRRQALLNRTPRDMDGKNRYQKLHREDAPCYLREGKR